MRKKKLVNVKDIAIIFSNVEQLVPVNMVSFFSNPHFFFLLTAGTMQELLRCLETRRSENPVVELVGDVFVRLVWLFFLLSPPAWVRMNLIVNLFDEH